LITEVIALDEGLDPALLDSIQASFWAGFGEALPTSPVLGRAALHARMAAASMGMAKLARARDLLTSGENLYMNFEYGPAAASLAESSGLFTASLAELEKADVELLYRARLLEGLAWLEAGQKNAAKLAFIKLVTIRPEFVPDPAMMPPHATAIFQEALAEVRARGLGGLEVRSDPSGAEVLVDGLARGKTPINVPGLPAGTHGLQVRHPGFGIQKTEVLIKSEESQALEMKLVPTDLELAMRRVEQAAKSGIDPNLVNADLQALMSVASVEGVVLFGVAKTPEGISVNAMRWTPTEKSAVLWRVKGIPKSLDVGRLVPVLLDSTWPAEQITQESPHLDADFERALLGLGPTFGRADVVEVIPITQTWWFWATGAGLAALAAGAVGATLVAVALTSGDAPEAPPDQVGMTLEFP
jgi:hypothetical protein